MGSAQIIGALEVSLGVSAFNSQRLEVALFDGMGESVLRLDLRESRVRFDQRKLSSGDYLICFRSPGPGVEGSGSYHTPHSRLLEGELPTRPQLDDILAEPSNVSLGDVAVPQFKFASR